jgi:UDP-N-acetylglucosamine acyltransferase
LANATTLAGHIVIDDWAIIGGMVGIHQFAHVGVHCMVAGGVIVRKDIPPYTKAAREPVSYVGVNSIGLRRRGFSKEIINQIQEIYRIIYLRGYNVSQALNIIEAEIEATPERDEILSFIANSTSGIMRGYGKLVPKG